MKYLWTENIKATRFPKLDGDTKTDVLIIGGGMAGVLCAHFLRERGVDCILVEASAIGEGITKGTTAVITAQHDTLYSDIVKKYGFDKAKQYLDANLWAVEQFRNMSQKINCDFEDKPSVMFSRIDKITLKHEAETICSLGFPVEFITKIPLPFEIAGAVSYPNMAQYHPLKFLTGIAKDLEIYEETFVHKVKGNTAYTDSGNINARKIIIATHYPFINSKGMYPMKLYQMRSFVVALENAPDVGGTYVDTAEGGMYLRNYKNYLLVGGGDHRTGAKGGGIEAVRSFVRLNFPDAKEKYAWATQDCMSLDGIPYIGRYSPSTPDVYVATGFNEWGMTSSMVSASILADMISGDENEFASVFNPNRSVMHKQLFVNLGKSITSFVQLTPKRCPHLGCALVWNKQEHSWDCPCHGSRFDEHGKLIDNPAMRDIHVD